MTDTDYQTTCPECGIVEYIEDMVTDGENDPTCHDCWQDMMQASMRDALRGFNPRYAAEARWYAEQGLDDPFLSEHDPRL